MKYRDLVQFNPITSVIQLRAADNSAKARNLVQSYVVSNPMADRLCGIVFPQLRWDNAIEHHGLLVVGNYGTGKSHLMSVISAIAEDAAMVRQVQSDRVRKDAEAVAGKFKVVRFEIGGVTTPLRDIFAGALQEFLDDAGVDFQIPPAAGLRDNKGWMADMMAAFHEKYPDHGLLFVVDEMLDYLRSLTQQNLILAFGLLREIGEIAETTRLRFIGGVQEMIFSSPGFQFVAESLARVAQRFETVAIERADVAYVVSERLLAKTAAQMDSVRRHLEPFAPCYDPMAAHMDEFCRLFPIHPDFLDVFGRVACAERREVLKTISKEMEALLDQEVPSDAPGIVSFDAYWKHIEGSPALRAVPDIGRVLDCTKVLDSKLPSVPALYRPLAERLVDALAVHRLTTGSVDSPIGLSAADLRDSLCLYDPNVRDTGMEPVLLEQNVGQTLDELKKAVSGQYISVNPDNHQYYIDVKKTVDVEDNIRVRIGSLDDGDLDRAWFEALRNAMELVDVPTKLSFANIWEFDELRWFSRNAPRRGYLFFGSPNERPTAQPPRDYYVYFLRPFDPVTFRDEHRDDEVFFRLRDVPDDLKAMLQHYAAAVALSQLTSAGDLRQAYTDEAKKKQKEINAWISRTGLDAFEVTYKGSSKKPRGWISPADLRTRAGIRPDEPFNLRDHALALAGVLFEDWFAQLAPDYPVFRDYIAPRAREGAVRDALGCIAGGASRQGLAVLEALKLLEGQTPSPAHSPYAQKVKGMLERLPDGQVVTRDKLLRDINQTAYFDPDGARLEEDWLVVVLGALVASGDLILSTLGHDYGAGDLATLSATPVADLRNFRHVSRPKGWSQDSIVALFEALGLGAAKATRVVAQNDRTALAELQAAAQSRADELSQLLPRVARPVQVLGLDLVELSGGASAAESMREAKSFLDSVRAYDTPAKLRNFREDPAAVRARGAVVAALPAWKKLLDKAAEAQALAGYLNGAAELLGPGHAWTGRFEAQRGLSQTDLAAASGLAKAGPALEKCAKALAALKKDYVREYAILHGRARLDAAGDALRAQLRSDPRLATLQKLASIEVMPRAELAKLVSDLDGLVACSDLDAAALDGEPSCPHCRYSPARDGAGQDAAAVLAQTGGRLDRMLADWTQRLLAALEEPTVRESVGMLSPVQKRAVERFATDGALPAAPGPELLDGLRSALTGLVKVPIDGARLLDELRSLGPAKPEEVIDFFRTRMNESVQSLDPDNARIVVE